MGRYAEGTKVPVRQSRTEIEHILERFGATGFMYGMSNDRAIVGFAAGKRQVRFYLPLKDLTPQETRQRWRALTMVIKAKLASVEDGIEEFDDAFLAQIILPDGQQVGEWARDQIEKSYSTGDMPPLLPAPRSSS